MSTRTTITIEHDDEDTPEFTAALGILTALCQELTELPLEEALATVELAESLGPFLVRPTDYLCGLDNLRDAREVLTAAIELKRVCRRITDREAANAGATS